MPQKNTQTEIKLLPFQQRVLEQVNGFDRVAFYLDMGLGKTYVGSEQLERFGNSTNLLICQNSKVPDWVGHFQTYYDFPVYNLRNEKQFEEFVFSSGAKTGVINYDLAWRRKNLLSCFDFSLMLDESSIIQNLTAKWTKFILSLKPRNVILLSGTPCSGKYENLCSQANLLGWNITEEIFFNQYINFRKKKVGNKIFREIDRDNPYKNIDRLKRKLAEHGAVFLKTEEVMELPGQVFIENKVDVTSDYRKFKKNRVIQLDDRELVGNTQLGMRLYARMLCGHYNQDKLQAFADILNSTGDRLVVFYNFNAEYEALKKIAEENGKPVSVINGKEKDLTAYDNCTDSVTLVQYQAGAMGLNLQKANRIIYFTLPERSDLFEQSKKRINRIGQNRTCFYHIMICRNSVEETIYRTLQMRKDYTDELFRKEFE